MGLLCLKRVSTFVNVCTIHALYCKELCTCMLLTVTVLLKKILDIKILTKNVLNELAKNKNGEKKAIDLQLNTAHHFNRKI